MPRLSLYRQRKNQRSSFTSNQLVLRRLSSVKFGKTLFDFVNLTYPSFSNTTSGDLSRMIHRIEDQRRHRYDPWLLTNSHILVKEKLYTKLKYSRCPQYDIVSGGFAALFAGFIGFLISEKFGIELVDSGDFYFALMYALFIGFISHLLTRLISTDSSFSLPFSLNHNKQFLWEFVMFCFKKIKS
jgi:hypothetical protein